MSESAGLVRAALRLERRAVRAALASGLLVTLCTVGLASTSAWLIVRAAQRPSVLSLTVPMGLVQLFALAKAAGRYLERTQTHRAALGAMAHVRADVARDLEPLLPAGLGPRSAEVVDRVLGDVERVQDLLTAVAGPLVTSVAAALVSAVVCGVLNWVSGLILLAAIAIDAVVLPAVALRHGAASSRESDAVHGELTSLFDEAAQSGDEFVMVGASRSLFRRLRELEGRADAASARRRAVTGLVSGLAVLVNGLAALSTALVSVQALRAGHVAAASVAVPALTTLAALELVSGVVGVVVSASRDHSAMQRLDALRGRTRPVREPDHALPVTSASEVTLDEVTHGYSNSPVLVGVDATLVAGDVVVLEGPSGGGKTTVARLIAKFLVPHAGTLRLDGRDYSQLASQSVREFVGLVDDAPHVFDGTLGDNLRLARPEASEEDLLAACEIAGLGDFVRGLPDGVGTRLGGVATGLSGGEQRRLGVAREVLADRPVAVFDEPTEGLDDATARALLDSLREHYRDGVLLIISHQDAQRLDGARRWRLEGGRLREIDIEEASAP